MACRGRASGRLDLLGGVADYAGALVLQMPTRQGIDVGLEPASVLVIGPAEFSVTEVSELAELPYPEMRAALAHLPRWTLYPLGVVLVLVRHDVIGVPHVRVSVTSDLPASVGVASSAALEVATARALAPDVDPLRLAALCQEAENHVVGAPCGIMDQVAVVAGIPGTVLPVLCRPASVDPPVRLPQGFEAVGWPTGALHDVGAAPYTRARTAAFMGKRLVEADAGRSWSWISQLPAPAVARLPDAVDGAAFLDRWDGTSDRIAAVDPDTVYPVRAATAFGGDEHRRAEAALTGLQGGDLVPLGPLMAASHRGYAAMGLGHPSADEVVEQALSHPGVIGARSSGGGSGGTVVVLTRRGALGDVDGLIR